MLEVVSSFPSTLITHIQCLASFPAPPSFPSGQTRLHIPTYKLCLASFPGPTQLSIWAGPGNEAKLWYQLGAYQRVERDCPCPYQSIESKNLWRYQTRSVDKRRGRIYECHRVSYTVHTCAYTISKATSLSKFSHGAKNYVNKLVNLSSKLQWRQYSGTTLNTDILETKIFVLRCSYSRREKYVFV